MLLGCSAALFFPVETAVEQYLVRGKRSSNSQIGCKTEQPNSPNSIFFLCFRDGSLQISSVQKYIIKKLDLTSENEVSGSDVGTLQF